MEQPLKLFVIAVIYASITSCAAFTKELRSGWARIDFADGKYHEEVVCQLSKEEGEITAQCAPLDDYLEHVLRKMDDLGMLKTPQRNEL